MKFTVRILAAIIMSTFANTTLFGQLIDSFSDGDFTNNPAWSGSTSAWSIVTDSDVAAGALNSYTLRLEVTSGAGTQYLSSQRTATWGSSQTWGFWLGRREQAATNANYSVVWLWASEADLTSATVDGYRIRFGDNTGDDEIRLQRVDDGVVTDILLASGAVPNGLTDIGFLVRITRASSAQWTIHTSALPTTNGTGAVATDIPSVANTFVNQGTATDGTYTDFSNGYLGFMAVHSSGAEGRSGVEFDQLYFAPADDALIPVELVAFTAEVSGGTVTVRWTTASETENLGFLLYRSEEPTDNLQQISDTMIPGAGNSAAAHDYSFVDDRVESEKTYHYQLADVDYNGNKTMHGPITAEVAEVPTGFILQQNFPNPGNLETTIEFSSPVAGPAVLTIYNSSGQIVRRQNWSYLPTGQHRYRWEGTGNQGGPLPSGLYFYRLEMAGLVAQKKMILLR